MIPNELKQHRNWCGWILTADKRKLPMNAITGKVAASDDKTTWCDFETAQEAVQRNHWSGLGFMFEPPFFGIDIDGCIQDGKINSFAQNVIDRVRSYSEVSQSGHGIHIIAKGELIYGPLKIGTKGVDGIEVYQTGRFFALTGNSVPLTVPLIRAADITFLYPEDRREAKLPAPPIKDRLAALSEGNRNTTFLSLAGSLRSKGFDNITIYELLKPRAEQEKFDLEELWTVCNRYPDSGPMNTVEGDDEDDFGAFMADRKPKQWLCKPIITKESLGFFVGLPEALKTWAAMDFAVECARGGKWLGKWDIKQGRVFFIDQERTKDETQNRFAAILKQKGLTPEDMRGKLVVKSGTIFRLDHQQSFDGIKTKLDKFEPNILIWDSWRTACNGDDKDGATVQAVLERAKELRKRYGCVVMFIDHENKNTFQVMKENDAPNYGNQAGSIAKPAAAEFIFTFRKETTSDSSWVYHVKKTQGKGIAPFLMRVRDTTAVEGESIIVEAQ